MPLYEYIDDTERFPAGLQVDAEEDIAGAIWAKQHEIEANLDEAGVLSEVDCQELGKAILLRVLTVFRPDLVQEPA